MSPTITNLEIQGTLAEHPFAELFIEASLTKLSGSFRLSHETQKVIVYLKDGEVVFAASNSRQHRLFERLIRTEKIQKERLAKSPNFTNDIEFSQSLIQQSILSKEEIDGEFSELIEEILKTVLQWKTGEWVFTPVARIRENIAFAADLPKILVEYARSLSSEYIAGRFKSFEEVFQVNSSVPKLNLQPHEAFIFSRFENQTLRIHDVQNLSGLPDSEVLKALYILWLGGFITRTRWNSAFTESKIAAINSAKLSLKKIESAPAEKQEIKPRIENIQPEKPVETIKVKVISESAETELSVDDYLNRVESAENYYEMFDIAIDAPLPAVKTAYFALAKSFHPDKYHQESNSALQQRIQHAFTEIARAYETLKSVETRQVYDFKVRKNLESGVSQKKDVYQNLNNADKAKEEFEQGFSLLMNENYNEAMPFLTRAVLLAPDNARYHAYYGKALSADEKQRFKADAEFQIAIRLDSNNPTFRLLLAEFYVQYNLLKRAEGELNRLLTLFPNNREAQALLDSLAKK